MRIVIIGAGAVGSYFGGKLAHAGSDVVFLARGKHLEALCRSPLRVECINGDFEVKVRATNSSDEAGVADLILVAVKAWQVMEAATLIPSLLGPDSVVVPLQNGVEAPTQLASIVGPAQVAGGLCNIIAQMGEPGHVRHLGAEPLIAFGKLSAHTSGERLEKAQCEFIAAGVNCEIPSNIEAAMWKKFIFIAPISGIGAVTRLAIGVVRTAPETRARLVRAIDEVVAVGRARGVALPPEIAEQTLAYIDSLPENATASMQRDIMAGLPSELEAQNGAVVRLGRTVGVPTPTHAAIYAALQPLEAHARMSKAEN
jgi:2-dehydropantoate 2-reductase